MSIKVVHVKSRGLGGLWSHPLAAMQPAAPGGEEQKFGDNKFGELLNRGWRLGSWWQEHRGGQGRARAWHGQWSKVCRW